MSHDLAEKTAGLASRVNNLAVLYTGDDCRALLEQQDRLAKLALAAIVKDLDVEADEYKSAIKGLDEAIAFIGEAQKKIQDIAKAIRLVKQTVDLVGKVITKLG